MYRSRFRPVRLSAAQHAANHAWREWYDEKLRLIEASKPLIEQGRWEELLEYQQTVLAAHEAKQPNQFA